VALNDDTPYECEVIYITYIVYGSPGTKPSGLTLCALGLM